MKSSILSHWFPSAVLYHSPENNKLYGIGKLEVQVGKSKEKKTFGITRAHLEEDAGTACLLTIHHK